jgi:hypothetical protein
VCALSDFQGSKREEQRERVHKKVEEKIELAHAPEEGMFQGIIEKNYSDPK